MRYFFIFSQFFFLLLMIQLKISNYPGVRSRWFGWNCSSFNLCSVYDHLFCSLMLFWWSFNKAIQWDSHNNLYDSMVWISIGNTKEIDSGAMLYTKTQIYTRIDECSMLSWGIQTGLFPEYVRNWKKNSNFSQITGNKRIFWILFNVART